MTLLSATRNFEGFKVWGWICAGSSVLLLLFVFQAREDERLVIVNTNTCVTEQISLQDIRFRGDFPSDFEPKQKIGDYIESYSSNRIVVVSKSLACFERSVIDLDRRIIKVVDLDIYSQRLDFHPRTGSPE